MAVAGRLVVLRALGLGDLLTALPAVRALARAFPDHHRVLAAPGWLAPLALLDDVVQEVVDVDLRAAGAPAPERPLPRTLHGADVAVNLHGRGPQSTRLLAATDPGRLIAFCRPGAPAWRADEHEVHRWCRLLAAHGITADPDALDLPVTPDPRSAGATLLHPGAARPARRWPVDRWAQLAMAQTRAGRRVLLTGTVEEAALARAIADAARLPGDAVVAGTTDVLELAALVAGADRLVCGDTGVGHLATATRTPSVLLFGPTSPARWGPPADRPWHTVLWHGDRGAGDPHAGDPDAALLAITVEEVLQALRELGSLPGSRVQTKQEAVT